MNWTQESDPRRLALLDRVVRANRALWDRFSLEAQHARVSALRDALDAGCGIEQVASALGVARQRGGRRGVDRDPRCADEPRMTMNHA